jgi:L-iditol 2-dehydrogenase
MKGYTVGGPGEVVGWEYPEPELGPGEALLAPLACGICTTDVKMVAKGFDGQHRYALGHELVGRVTAVAPPAPLAVGQRVVVAPYVPCGGCFFCRRQQPTLCEHLFDHSLSPGGLAQRVRLPARLARTGALPVPDHLPDADAALAEPLGCALQGVQDAGLRPGDATLIVGDGPMGLICAAVARAAGAAPLIVAGQTPHRLAAAARLADAVVDTTAADLPAAVRALTHGRGADVVLVVVSDGPALAAGLAALRPGGALNAFAGVPPGTTLALDVRRLHYQQLRLTGSFGLAPAHLAQALRLLAAGRVDAAALITARFPFERTPDALAYAAQRQGLKALVVFDDGAPAAEPRP